MGQYRAPSLASHQSGVSHRLSFDAFRVPRVPNDAGRDEPLPPSPLLAMTAAEFAP